MQLWTPSASVSSSTSKLQTILLRFHLICVASAKILYVKGRQHPVKILHTAQPQTDYIESALQTFYQIHTEQPAGDVLIFLPGQEDIDALASSITSLAERIPSGLFQVLACPIYAALPPSAQAKVFSKTPSNTRKVVLATNIAETSITIPGIKYVIDTGYCKEKRYFPRGKGNGVDALMLQPVSKSSALQRTGRAGREVRCPAYLHAAVAHLAS